MSLRTRKLLILATAVIAVLTYAGTKARRSTPRDAVMDRSRQLASEKLEARFEALKPLHQPMGKPKGGEWLAEHLEDGQSFAEYLKSEPVRVSPARRTIYLQPIGDFSPAQRKVLDRTADFIGRFYQLPVTTLPALPSSVIPAKARRVHPTWGVPQILTTYVLQELLVPKRPDDAIALLALTQDDLYPAPDWNFVFGQASLAERVGVWSIARNGDVDKEPALFLSRTLKTAVHELGHMLSIQHCLAFECVMNGSNSREESDVRPLELCPVCLQKLTWNVGLDPAKRFEALSELERDAGLDDDRAFIDKSLAVLYRTARASDAE